MIARFRYGESFFSEVELPHRCNDDPRSDRRQAGADRLHRGPSSNQPTNQQPELAGDPIAKTVAGMSQMQATQSPAQSIDMSEITGTGKIINITA